MSTGNFLVANYESDTGTVHNILIQPETATLQVGAISNTIPAGPVDDSAPAIVSGGRNRKGLNARLIRFVVTVKNESPFDVGRILVLPWLDPGTFLSVTRPGRQSGLYQSAAIRVVGGSCETVG